MSFRVQDEKRVLGVEGRNQLVAIEADLGLVGLQMAYHRAPTNGLPSGPMGYALVGCS